MKLKSNVALITLIVLISVFLTACNDGINTEELWKDAIYTENKSFGEGEKTVVVTVTAGDRSIDFTVKTDKEMLGDALIEHGIIQGEQGPYGLMIEKVNGIEAIYDKDQAYWALFKGDTYSDTGVDTTPIENGSVFTLKYIKE